MEERRNKRGSGDVVGLEEDAGASLEPARIEVGSGYTVAVGYDENQRPVVNVKTYGRVDLSQLRREVGRIFPNAQIRQKVQLQL
jgi:hypothetical protein